MTDEFIRLAAQYCPAITLEYGEPLSKHTTFRIGGECDVFALPKNEEELIGAVRAAKESGMEYYLLGNGSNVLFSDKGFRGVVISTAMLKKIGVTGKTVKAQCGTSLSALALAAAHASLDGVSFAYGIPGTVGGGVFMNAGAYGGQLSDVVAKSRYYDPECGKTGCFSYNEHKFAYRQSVYNLEHTNYIILDATFELTEGCSETILTQMTELMAARREKQPLEYPSAGSTFKRYPGYYTGKLIEESGLKGYTYGGAQVSEKHGGFVINRGGATAEDVMHVVNHVKEVIHKNYGIDLECEIRVIGGN